MLEGLPGDARRVVGLPRCGASCHFVELLEPRGRQPLGGHPAGGHRVVAAAVERCGHVGRDDAGTAGDILAAGDPASVVVAYAAAVARASGVIGSHLAPVVVSREGECAQGLNHQPRHDVLALVLVLGVDPFAVEYADVVVEDTVSVAVDQSAVELCAQVASRGVDAANVGEPHQAADRHRIFDEFVFERHVVRVLDRERNLELSDLHVEGFQRFVAQVDVDDLGRCEFELQPVVDLGRNVALEVHAGAFDEEGRCVVAPFVTQLQIAGDAREARQDPVGGRRPAFERFDLRREAFDGSSERVALLRGAPCRRKEAGGDRQRKEESLHGS